MRSFFKKWQPKDLGAAKKSQPVWGTPALALAILSVGVVQPSAAAPADLLILKGDSDSYVDVVLDRPLVVHARKISATTDGSYAGFVIHQHPGMGRRAGAVVLPAFDETGNPFGPLLFSYGTVRLKPGNYRIFLLTDGRTEVTIPVEGSTGTLTLEPELPAKVDAEVLDLSLLPEVAHGEARIPVDIGPGAHVSIAALSVYDFHQVSAMEACVAETDGPECVVWGGPPSTSAVYPGPSIGRGYTAIFANGNPPPGQWDVLIRTEAIAARAEALLGFYMVHQPRR